MIPCHQCSRHIRAEDLACPFCAWQRPGTIAAAALFVLLGVAGCGAAVSDNGGDATTSGTDTGPATTVSMTTMMTTASSVDTGTSISSETGTSSTSTGNDDVDDGGCAFYGCPVDSGPIATECDLFAQDCPRGEKCMPWANDNGSAWNATRCTPVDPSPVGTSEVCTVQGSGTSGIDNCELGALCWDVDPETNMGTCVAMCHGSEALPVCEDPQTDCFISVDAVLILCLPVCNPVVQDCAVGDACLPNADGFLCMADDATGDAGQGEACAIANECSAGLLCVSPDAVPECAGAGCCTSYCDLDDPQANADCAAAAPGTECVSIYDGQPAEGFEFVGACLMPV
jgi:hypothetical protein